LDVVVESKVPTLVVLEDEFCLLAVRGVGDMEAKKRRKWQEE
jgi:hypothetical protein